MRVLVALTYYRPHISGLTMYAQRLAEGLVAAGHRMTVLTSSYDQDLPAEETRNGVRVIRVPVLSRIGKGVVMTGYRRQVRQLVEASDLVLINYPITPPESGPLLNAARRARVPVVAAYQCDIELPHSRLNSCAQRWLEASARRLLSQAARVVVLARDYAETSRLLQPHLAKCVALPPPVTLRPPRLGEAAAWRKRHAADADVVVGLAARISAEKGIEYLLAARDPLRRLLGDACLLIAGEKHEGLGEGPYWAKLRRHFDEWGDRAAFVGRLSDREMAAFFAACDVTVLPSVNRTESFGLVQVESMLCGTPVVATDLPGIREPIRRSGMGALVPPHDSEALAEAIARVVREREALTQPPERISAIFGVDGFVPAWEVLCAGIARNAVPPAPRDELRDLMRLHLSRVPPFRALVRAAESNLIRRYAPRVRPVLDLGCGDGQFAAATLPTPVAYGLDPDPTAIDRARRGGIYENLTCGPADRLPLADGSCGLVLANSVLEHIQDVERPLAEVHRVLRDDGWFIVTSPSHRFSDGFGLVVALEGLGLKRCARRYTAWFNRRSGHHHLDSSETWRERLRRSGFSVVRHEYYLSRTAMFWFDLLHYVSVPSLLAFRRLGRWHWLGRPLFLSAWTVLLTRLARRLPEKEGAYVFLLARKE
jgi:glycosyltransferase involved in cell wall biosynthesis